MSSKGWRALRPVRDSPELVHRLTAYPSACCYGENAPRRVRRMSNCAGVLNAKDYLALVRGQWQSHVKTVQAPLLKNILQSGVNVLSA